MAIHQLIIPMLALIALALLGAGCAHMEGSFREGNVLRNPPAEAGIFVTSFDVKTPYRIVGVVEARAFPAFWAPPLTEQEMHRNLVEVAIGQREKVDAIIQVQLIPYSTVWRRRGMQARGLAVRYLASAQGKQSAEEFFLEGWRAISEERFEDAIVDFLHVIRLDPTIGEAHFNLAQLYLDKKQYDRALWHIDTFLKNYPNRDQSAKGQELRDLILEESRAEERSHFWNSFWSGTKTAGKIILTPIGFLIGI